VNSLPFLLTLLLAILAGTASPAWSAHGDTVRSYLEITPGDLDELDALPFIDTVPCAPDEARRLTAEGYRPYGAVKL
jgi:hypothetical protein